MSDETSTVAEPTAKDVTSSIEAILYGSDEEAPIETTLEEVSEDEQETDLPEDDDTEDEDDGEEDLESIAEDEELSLANYLGLDDERIVETDDGLAFTAIIDGEQRQVPLKDLVADYQLKSHVNNKSIALEEQRKEFEEQRNTVATEISERVKGLEKLHAMAEEQLIGDYNAIDWASLRTEDPANWTALRQEYAEKAQQIQQAQELVKEESTRLESERQAELKNQMQDHLSKEFDQMLLKNPNWTDQVVLKKDMGDLKTFVSSTYGYDAADFDNVSDHRLIELIKDAKAFREGKKGIEKKLVKKVPKFTKPGARKANAASLAKARKVKADKAALRNDGGIDSVANALLDRM